MKETYETLIAGKGKRVGKNIAVVLSMYVVHKYILIVYVVHKCIHNVSLWIMTAVVNSIIASQKDLEETVKIFETTVEALQVRLTGSIMHLLCVWLTCSFSFAITYIVTERTEGLCRIQQNL